MHGISSSHTHRLLQLTYSTVETVDGTRHYTSHRSPSQILVAWLHSSRPWTYRQVLTICFQLAAACMQCLDIAMGIVANCMKSYYDNILLFISLLYLLYLEFCLQGINFHISPHTKTAHTGILRCAHCHISRIFIFSDLYCISHFFRDIAVVV